MATKKPKKTAKKSSKPKAAAKSKKTSKSAAVATQKRVAGKTNPVKTFFAKKYDSKENILTIFKTPKIYGALLGEVVGTMILTTLLLTLGLYQPLYLMLALIGVSAAIFKLSGANLNPAITAGMMATRRMSAIRGVLYIVAQIVGAWLGLLVINGFRLASGTSTELPMVAEIESTKFWYVTLTEFFGATIIGYTFARAWQYKKSPLTFGCVVASGIMVAVVTAIITSSYASMSNSFVMNPAVALMYQILPVSGENFGTLMGEIALALVTYAVFPILGSIIGFYISDLSTQLVDGKVE